MRGLRIAAFAAVALVSMVGCSAAPPGQTAASLAQERVAVLDGSWMVASSLADTYVLLGKCDPACADAIERAKVVADAAVKEAREQILAAGEDRAEILKWVSYGLSALTVLRTALVTYGAPPG